ncbi:hypothetical protein IMY05_C4574000700 [Salix suchowensis]|nr:hypothetical protein IMY05_C4574000700 [Salix suchowensis]
MEDILVVRRDNSAWLPKMKGREQEMTRNGRNFEERPSSIGPDLEKLWPSASVLQLRSPLLCAVTTHRLTWPAAWKIDGLDTRKKWHTGTQEDVPWPGGGVFPLYTFAFTYYAFYRIFDQPNFGSRITMPPKQVLTSNAVNDAVAEKRGNDAERGWRGKPHAPAKRAVAQASTTKAVSDHSGARRTPKGQLRVNEIKRESSDVDWGEPGADKAAWEVGTSAHWQTSGGSDHKPRRDYWDTPIPGGRGSAKAVDPKRKKRMQEFLQLNTDDKLRAIQALIQDLKT